MLCGTVKDVKTRLQGFEWSPSYLRELIAYESGHEARKLMLKALKGIPSIQEGYLWVVMAWRGNIFSDNIKIFFSI